MKILKYLTSSLFACLLFPVLHAQPVFTETFLIVDQGGVYKQVVLLEDNGELPGDRVEFENEEGAEVFYDLPQLDKMGRHYVIPCDEVEEETEIRITFWQVEGHSRPRKDRERYFVTLRPQKHWEFYLTPHTHLDIGFTEHQDVVWENLCENLLVVMDMVEQTINWPVGSRYRWTIEQTQILEKFLEYYPEQSERLLMHIMHGNIEVCGFNMNMLSALCSSEELVRTVYPAEELRQKYDLTINTAMINDVPGYTWSLAQVFSKAGIEFVALRANMVRSRLMWYLPESPDRPFYWEAPDGSKVLAWYTDSYREGNFMRQSCGDDFWDTEYSRNVMENFARHIERIENRNYPFTEVQLRMGGDNITATPGPSQVAREWNKKWAYPKLTVATNRDFYEAIRVHEADIPTYKGDITDYWTDGAMSSAWETTLTRRAQDDLAQGETFSSMLSLLYPEYTYPAHRIENAYQHIMLYNEHTWGSSAQLREKDYFYQRSQWNEKSGYALTGYELAHSTLRKAHQSLPHLVSNPGRVQATVFNSLSWPRDGVVKIDLNAADSIGQIIDLAENRECPFQIIQKDSIQREVWFVVKNIPAMGYKNFQVLAEADTLNDSLKSMTAGAFYTYNVNEPGMFEQLSHSASGRSLIDTEAPFGFFDYIYETGFPRPWRLIPTEEVPGWDRRHSKAENVRMVLKTSGPVADIYHFEGSAEGVNSLNKEIIVYKGINRIDLACGIDKQRIDSGEAVYFAFPFRMDKPRALVDIPMAAMQPGNEQLPNSNKDFYTIERYVQLQDEQGTISLCSPDVPLFSLYDINVENYLEELPESNGHLYAYALNNYWYTNYRFWQDGPIEFRFSMRYEAKQSSPAETDRFAMECSRPLVCLVSNTKQKGVLDNDAFSMASLSEGAMIQSFKKAENGKGWILRLNETDGKGGVHHLEFNPMAKPIRAWEATITEQMQDELGIRGNALEISLGPYETKTIWLWFEEE